MRIRAQFRALLLVQPQGCSCSSFIDHLCTALDDTRMGQYGTGATFGVGGMLEA